MCNSPRKHGQNSFIFYFLLGNGYKNGIKQSSLGFDDDNGGDQTLKTYKFREIPLLQPCAIHTISRYLYSSGQQASESYHTLHQMQGDAGMIWSEYS